MERLHNQPVPDSATFRIWLILGNLLMAVGLTSGAWLSLSSALRADEAVARESAENLASSLSSDIEAEVRLIDNALLTVALRAQDAQETGRRAAVALVLGQQRELLGHVDALRFADKGGRVELGLQLGEKAISIADRSYFKQAQGTAGLVISEPLISRVSGKWCVIFARRTGSTDETFVGVVYAVVLVDRFKRRFQQMALGTAGAIALRDSHLRLVARFAPSEVKPSEGVGEVNMAPPLVQMVAANPGKGWYLGSANFDKVERIAAYRKVEDYPLTVYAGLATADFLSNWRRQAAMQVALVMTILLGTGVVSRLILLRHRVERDARDAAFKVAREQSLLLENELVGMARIKGRVVVWGNRALETIFGYPPGSLRGAQSRTLYLDDASYDMVGTEGYASLSAGKTFRVQVRMRRCDGRPVWIDLSGASVTEDESLWMMLDIDALKVKEHAARELAMHDALTGLPNRRLFEEKLDDALARALITQTRIAVVYLDLDGFKPINDCYGHEAGDVVLRVVGQRLAASLRGNDVIARLGGDEFALLLDSVASETEVESVLQRCSASLRQPIAVNVTLEVSVDASFGAVLTGGADLTLSEVMRRSDQAMYASKRAGKGGVRIWRSHSPAAL